MISEQYLMRNLMRTCAVVRRPHKSSSDEKSVGKKTPRGFGHILDLLSVEEGMSQQQIADTLGIRPQSVSEAIVAMESRGCIRKETSASDRRVTLIYLTAEGAQRREELAREREIHARRFFSVLDEAEKKELNRLLEKLNCAFSDREEDV